MLIEILLVIAIGYYAYQTGKEDGWIESAKRYDKVMSERIKFERRKND